MGVNIEMEKWGITNPALLPHRLKHLALKPMNAFRVSKVGYGHPLQTRLNYLAPFHVKK